MKRNTLFLLSYSIIIPLVSSANIAPPKDKNLTSLSFVQYQTLCEKYSKKNYTNVQDYVKNCTDDGRPVKNMLGVIQNLCFGVVNNILVACDKSAEGVLQFLNNSVNIKSDSSSYDPEICPLGSSIATDFLNDEKFSRVKKTLKIKIKCVDACITFDNTSNEHCDLWHKTNVMLMEQDKSKKQANGETSQDIYKDSINTGSKSVPGSTLPDSKKKDVGSHLKNVESSSNPVGSNQGVNTEKQADPVDKSEVKQEPSNNSKNPPVNKKPDSTKDAKEENKPKTEKNEMEQPERKKETAEASNPENKGETAEASNTANKDEPAEASKPANKDEPAQAPDGAKNEDKIKVSDESINAGDQSGKLKEDMPIPPDIEDNPDNQPPNIPNPGFNNQDDIRLEYTTSPLPNLDQNKMLPDNYDDDSGSQLDNPVVEKTGSDPETAASKSVSLNDASPFNENLTEEESHFYVYFFTSASIVILGYVAFHNKNKILAYALEGRRSRNGRRRPNSASYRKLDCSLEEAITSNSSHASVTNVVY